MARCSGSRTKIQKALPGTPSLDPGAQPDFDHASNGTGSVNRAETVKLTVAAVITDKLPNGNLVIGGSQEVRSTTSCANFWSPA